METFKLSEREIDVMHCALQDYQTTVSNGSYEHTEIEIEKLIEKLGFDE